ncbi:hypothetical protein, partial [Pseudomonas umsongensis]|uniref:hypothetical protein n=1 Tax=Pseudomonas umsongensis TaxID=198618 RepID=UPI00200B38FE
MFFYNLTSTRVAVFLFVLAVSLVYMWLPIFVNFSLLPSEYFLKLAFMTFFAIVSVLVGYSIPIFDSRFRPQAIRIRVGVNTVHLFVWTVFVIFLVITLYTAPAIPILSALSGADTDELSVQRGA